MRRLRLILLLLTLAAGITLPVDAQRVWRETSRELPQRSLNDPRLSDGVEIYGNNGAIIIRTPRRVQVRVFTILGQLVSQTTLNPGVSELRIGARGIYLVKVGNITQKVAL